MKNFGVLLICTMIISVGDYFIKKPKVESYTEPKIMNEYIVKREHYMDSIYNRVKANSIANTIELEQKKRIAKQKNNN